MLYGRREELAAIGRLLEGMLWQIPAFLVTGLLVLALPKVKPTATVPGGA